MQKLSCARVSWEIPEHYDDVIMTTLRLKSPASRLFTQSFIQAYIKENIKAPPHWPLCGEFTGTDEFPAQRASNAENVSIWWRHHGQPAPINESSFSRQKTRGWLFRKLQWYQSFHDRRSRRLSSWQLTMSPMTTKLILFQLSSVSVYCSLLYNERDGAPNHHRLDCLLLKYTSWLCHFIHSFNEIWLLMHAPSSTTVLLNRRWF